MLNIFGWDDERELAQEVFCSLTFSQLLEGSLVFAYKNQKKTGTVGQLVISKRLDGPDFMVGQISFGNGWTCFLPHAPYKYLDEVIRKDLETNKTEQEILQSFTENINKYGK